MKGVAEAFADLHKLIKCLKKRQSATGIFLTTGTPPPGEPQAGASGGLPEEGIVAVGDGSCVRVIAPETFQRDEKRSGGGRQ